jgi:hypothetical protein
LNAYSAETGAYFRNEGCRVLDALVSAGAGFDPAAAAAVATAAGMTATPPLTLAQSSSSQAALEISGWVAASHLHLLEAAAPAAAEKSDAERTASLAWVQRWVCVLRAACPAQQSVALRLSAAKSLLHANALGNTINAPGAGAATAGAAGALISAKLGLCLSMLTLLQDDDEDVRDVINALLAKSANYNAQVNGPESSAESNVNSNSVKIPVYFAATEVCRRK